MTLLERLELRLEQLYLAESKITAQPKKNPDGTYALDSQGNKIFIQGSQSFTIGDTTYTRAKLPYLHQEIERLETKINELKVKQSGKLASKPRFYGATFE